MLGVVPDDVFLRNLSIFFFSKKPIHLYLVIPDDVGGKKHSHQHGTAVYSELFSRMFPEQKSYKTEMSPSCERAHLFVSNTVLFLCEEYGRWLCLQPPIKD